MSGAFEFDIKDGSATSDLATGPITLTKGDLIAGAPRRSVLDRFTNTQLMIGAGLLVAAGLYAWRFR